MPARNMNQKIAVSVVFVAAMFMTIMDTTIVNVALPTLGRDFHVGGSSVDTVSIGFLVSLAVFIPASGWLGDRLGARKVLLVAIVIFTAASALCGLATNLGELVTFRVLQGVGGGMLAPVGMAMLFRTFPPSERVRASSILTVATAMAPTLGPILGGLFVTDLSWRWVFYVNLPIGVGAFVFGLVFLAEQEQANPGRFDLPGFLLAGIGLASLMYGVSEGPSRGWGSAQVLVTLLAGAILLATMVVVELRTTEPMLHLRLFTNRLFRSINVAMSCGFAALMGLLFLAALFFQDGLGLSALQSGLSTFPEAIGVMTGAQLVSRDLYPRLGPRRLAVAGLLVVAVTLSFMSLLGAHDSLWWMRGLMYVAGLGISAVLVPSQAAGFATISPAETGQASTLFNSIRQLGGAIGVAVVATVVSAIGPTRVVGGHTVAHLSAYHWAFLAAAGLAVIGAGLALTIQDRDAAPTFRGRLEWGQTSKPADRAPTRTPAPSPAAGA